MKERILTLVRTFLGFTLASLTGKLAFCGFYAKLMEQPFVGDIAAILWHGLSHDFCIAGYLTVLPALLLTASLFTPSSRRPHTVGSGSAAAKAPSTPSSRRPHTVGSGSAAAKPLPAPARWPRRAWDILIWTEAIALATAICTNIGLYEYWRFPLDATPLFYFLSSPKDAFASVSPRIVLAGLAAIAFFAFFIARLLVGRLPERLPEGAPTRGQRIPQLVAMLALTASLFLPIRGGFTVSTMNTGHVFFSPVQTRNHAAVAPLFSLIESLGKQADFSKQYRFFDDAEAHAIFNALHTPTGSIAAGTETPLLNTEKPDILLVILESFSAKLMRTLGGEANVTPCLEEIAAEGLLFTNFYANSFRTDRGLVAILSGYPAQPTTSVMKYPQKTAHLPSLARSLGSLGYSASYFYGGDADFTNMRSYLINQGFGEITEDTDFPLSQRLSKWGVHDHLLFQRALEDIKTSPANASPRFRVIQTSSSHEPFEVPYHRLADERLNAFAYTDSCLGAFIHDLRALPAWDNTLVVIVPDHLGAYPKDIDNLSPERYRIPLVMTGGALQQRGRIPTVGSQIDISATLYAAVAPSVPSAPPFAPAAPSSAPSASPSAPSASPSAPSASSSAPSASASPLTVRGGSAAVALSAPASPSRKRLAAEFPFGKNLFDPQIPHFAFFTFPDAMGYVDAESIAIYDNQASRTVLSRGRDTDLALRRAKAYLQCLYDDLAAR